MRDREECQVLIKLLESGREFFREGGADQAAENLLVDLVSDMVPHLERHLRYAILDKNSGHMDEIIGAALDHIRTLQYSFAQPIEAPQPISQIRRPLNEILLSMLIQPRDASALLGDLEELHNGTESPAYWRDFVLAAITLLSAMIMKTMRLERVFKGNR